MKRLLLLPFLVILCCPPILKAQKKEGRLSDGIQINIPEGLTAVTPSMQKSTSPVVALFMSEDGQAELGINQSSQRWGGNDLALSQRIYKANILNLYDQVEWLQEDVAQWEGRDYLVFEFIGTITGEVNAFRTKPSQKDYVFVMYHIIEEGVLIFRFSAPYGLMSRWQKPVTEAMRSVRIENP